MEVSKNILTNIAGKLGLNIVCDMLFNILAEAIYTLR